MRVLPAWGSTAPRLPLEKSYSAFTVPALLARCAPCRDQSESFRPFGIHDDQQFARAALAQLHIARFILGFWVRDADRQRVHEHAFGIGERHPVLAQIARQTSTDQSQAASLDICMIYAFNIRDMMNKLLPETVTPQSRTMQISCSRVRSRISDLPNRHQR